MNSNNFECFCGENFDEHGKSRIRQCCERLGFYKKFNGESYCVLHYPEASKIPDFTKALNRKIENNDFNFTGVYFPEAFEFPLHEVKSNVSFQSATFSSTPIFNSVVFKEKVSFFKANFFRGALFNNVTFKKSVDFGSYFEKRVLFEDVETLSDISFSEAIIATEISARKCRFKGKTLFHGTKFKECNFSDSHFVEVEFNCVQFNGQTNFFNNDFYKTQFSNCVFKDHSSFRKSVFNEQVRFDCEFHLDAKFSLVKFIKNADFTKVKFGDDNIVAHCNCLKGGYFESAWFQGFAIFEESTFENANFTRAVFEKEAVFRATAFEMNADFGDAHFKSTANFKGASFHQKAIFQGTIFDSYLRFIGSKDNSVFCELNGIDLTEIRIDSTEKIQFHTVLLRPSWFLDVDCRKIIFTRIDWKNADGKINSLQKEIDNVKNINDSRKLLIIACRQLAVNAEENNRFEEASNFRKSAFEIERLERKENRKIWRSKFNEAISSNIYCSTFFSNTKSTIKKCWALIRGFPSDALHFFYRISSGYGEKWFHAFCWLIFIWLFWAFLYASPICNFAEKENYDFSYWIGYSLNVITLQRPDPKPANNLTMVILGLEVLLAPVQAALLILAVRRKFMR